MNYSPSSSNLNRFICLNIEKTYLDECLKQFLDTTGYHSRKNTVEVKSTQRTACCPTFFKIPNFVFNKNSKI